MNKSILLREMLTSPGTRWSCLTPTIRSAPGSSRAWGSRRFSARATVSPWRRVVPSEAEFGIERNLALTKSIVEAVRVPVMADGEDGFGDPPAVAETVRCFHLRRRCGNQSRRPDSRAAGPKGVIDRSLMIEKIRAAREAARQEGQPELIINGRTDALAVASDRNAG